MRADSDYEGNLQVQKKTIQGELISASCKIKIKSDKDIFHFYFLLKKTKDVLKNIFENLLRIVQELHLRTFLRTSWNLS